jgi:tetratricopeptide (TPR) repeat protein
MSFHDRGLRRHGPILVVGAPRRSFGYAFGAPPRVSYLQKELYEEAIQAFRAGMARSEHLDMKAYLGYTLALAGRTNEAREILDELRVESAKRYVPPDYLGLIHLGLDERNTAFEWLDRALTARVWSLAYLNVDPIYDVVRSDERFKRLLRAVDLP